MKKAVAIVRKKYKKAPFTRQDLLKIGISRYGFMKLLKNNDIEKISHGIYQLATNDLSVNNKFRIALYRVGSPACICLLSALEYYNLTDYIPNKTWVMVPMQKRSALNDLKLFRSRNPKWNIGIKNEDGFQITDVERTIVDSIVYKKIIGSNIAIDALRQALKEKKTTLKRISDMAVNLKVFHRIKTTIEVLA